MPSGKKKEKGDLLWFKLVLFLVPRLVELYFRIVDATSKKIWLNRDVEERICKKQPFTCACFHGTMLFPVYYCRNYPGIVMVSRSWDGEIIDRSIRRMGYDTARGSSSKGGKEALWEMIDVLKEKNYCSGLAVDAPRGPSRKVKIGTIIIARETGQPVVPFVSWATRQIQFKSWDKMILPLPFSTIVMAFGEETFVPSDLPSEQYEEKRQAVEDRMLAAQNQAEETVQKLRSKK
jgi:lysophospholipid acyltransferase (LPLAT)-like uncharacterized protein